MNDLLPPSIGVIILYLIIRFFIKFDRKMTKTSGEEGNSIKGDTFTMRDETPEEKNDPIKKLIEEAKRVNETVKGWENKHK